MDGRIGDERHASERRLDPRIMCAELVEVEWKDKTGRLYRDVGNLEDISASGACLQLETPLQRGTRITIYYGGGELPATVRYCLYRDFAYFLGLEFAEGCKWTTKRFRPQYMLDPREMMRRTVKRRGLRVSEGTLTPTRP